MVTRNQIAERRAKVSQLLAKSVTSIKEIATALQIDYETVRNDIGWLKEQTKPWLFGLTGHGFAFDCKNVIDSFLNMEVELEEMRQIARKNKEDTSIRLSIIRELRDTRIARLSVEAEGPTLLALRKIKNGERE